jgi:16S rRNA (adenine1518-N6/adenine1519-N6)-dimethyltransferase
MNLCSPSVIRALMQEVGITFRREYGQNFLVNPEIPARIADECADSPDTVILEIGPGIGCLTAELAERYERVVAIEIDGGLIPVLKKTLADYPNATVIHGDCMKVDLAECLSEAVGDRVIGRDVEVAVCANLPYYITTPILMHLLECGIPFSSITVMIQREVADRLSAEAGKSDYGAITAVLGYYGNARRLFTVPAGCFLPAPKVSSAVVRIDLPKTPKYSPRSEKLFFRTVHAAFEQRRKTLLNALSAKLGELGKDRIAEVIASCGFVPDIRGERLSTADFVRLSDCLAAAIEEKNTPTP